MTGVRMGIAGAWRFFRPGGGGGDEARVGILFFLRVDLLLPGQARTDVDRVAGGRAG